MSNQTELEQLKENFQFTLSKMSHEIRNPVTLINTYLQMMEKKYPQVEELDYWENIRENMTYLIGLLDELSVYNNAARLRTETLDLAQLLQSVADSVRISMEYLGIKLNLQIPDEVFKITGDKTKLREAFLNILRNASEAVRENGEIRISLRQLHSMAEISISDNGEGIPAEYLPTLFDPFVTHKKEGTGLGLAITRQIIKAHGGDIQVSSAPGKGASFILFLPMAPV